MIAHLHSLPAHEVDDPAPGMHLAPASSFHSMAASMKAVSMNITIYHNPSCGTSRNTLALIRNAGIEPTVVDYLAHPPAQEVLRDMIAKAGLRVREAMRSKEKAYAELGLQDDALNDDQLLDAMIATPVLINRPFVVTPWGTRLCRPSELVLDILPLPQKGPFAKEDGEAVIDGQGRRVS